MACSRSHQSRLRTAAAVTVWLTAQLGAIGQFGCGPHVYKTSAEVYERLDKLRRQQMEGRRSPRDPEIQQLTALAIKLMEQERAAAPKRFEVKLDCCLAVIRDSCKYPDNFHTIEKCIGGGGNAGDWIFIQVFNGQEEWSGGGTANISFGNTVTLTAELDASGRARVMIPEAAGPAVIDTPRVKVSFKDVSASLDFTESSLRRDAMVAAGQLRVVNLREEQERTDAEQARCMAVHNNCRTNCTPGDFLCAQGCVNDLQLCHNAAYDAR